MNKCALVGNPESADNAGSLADAFNRKEQETGILPYNAGIDMYLLYEGLRKYMYVLEDEIHDFL